MIEYFQAPRRGGKTTYLAQRVAELQDEGADLVVVIVPAANYVDHWFKLLFEVGIDPSRFAVVPAQSTDRMRGQSFRIAGVDDADTIQPNVLDDALHSLLPGDPDPHYLIMTYTDPAWQRPR